MGDNAVLEAALEYAKHGLAVFPCRGKRPTTPNGFKDASAVPQVITSWFKDHPELNVAIRIPEWAVVVDVDGEVGVKNLKTHGYTLPETSRAKTGNGWHHWYLWKFGDSPPQRKVSFLPKVDILTNGYVLAPPSRHPAGPVYVWEEPFTESAIEIAPDWLHTTVDEVSAKRKAIDVDDFFNGLPKGQRQTGLFRYACRLRGLPRMTKSEAMVLVRELAKRSEFTDCDPAELVERVWKTYDEAKSVDLPPPEVRVWSLADLLSEVNEPPNYLVENMVPGIGYTILFAAQGAGKSMLADEIAICVATGERIFGRKTRQAGALVLDLEQEEIGASVRWRKLMKGMGLYSPPANLHTAFSWPTIDEGGLDKLATFLVDHPHIQLVVVDSLYNLAPDSLGDSYFHDGKSMSRFTRFANEYGIAFLIIHHSRKSSREQADNFADMASGTRGVTGPAKARLGLTRDELGDRGTLMIGGKLPESKIEITFDRENLMWR